MFGKLATVIVGAEIIGGTILGAWIYSEFRYHQGRRDAYKDVNNKLGELLKDVGKKHEPAKEEA